MTEQREQTASQGTRQALLGALVGLGRAAQGNKNRPDAGTHQALGQACRLAAAAEGTEEAAEQAIEDLHREKFRMARRCLTCKRQCGRNDDPDLTALDRREERLALLETLCRLGAGLAPDPTEEEEPVYAFLYDGLFTVGAKEPEGLAEMQARARAYLAKAGTEKGR